MKLNAFEEDYLKNFVAKQLRSYLFLALTNDDDGCSFCMIPPPSTRLKLALKWGWLEDTTPADDGGGLVRYEFTPLGKTCVMGTFRPTKKPLVPDITSMEVLGEVIAELRYRLLFHSTPTTGKLRRLLTEFAEEHNLKGLDEREVETHG